MANGKKNGELQVDWTVQLDFEKDGSLKSIPADVRPGEEQSAGRILPELQQILGDMPVGALGHEALNMLRDTLLKLPANNRFRQTRGKSIDDILALGLSPPSPLFRLVHEGK